MAWLSDWRYRIPITIDADKFDNHATEFTAVGFPYAIHVGSSVGQSNQDLTTIFDKIGSNSLKMAITEDDGTTECYFEIERWDNSNKKGLIWFQSSDADYSSGDYTFYIYFDNTQPDNNTYGGTLGNRGEVWTARYKAVYHMADASGGLTDSSGNGYDTSVNQGSGTPVYRRNGYSSGCGYAIEFDRSCRFYRSSVGIDFGGSGPTDWCVMAYGDWDDVNADQYFLLGDPNYGFYIRVDDSSGGKLLYKIDDGVDDDYGYSINGVYSGWHMASQTLDYSIALHEGFRDGIEEYQGNTTDVNLVGDLHNTIEIGGYTNGTGMDGLLGEVRISNYEWNDRWQRAEYHTLNDDIAIYGALESLSQGLPCHHVIII